MTGPGHVQGLLEARVDDIRKVHGIPGIAVLAFRGERIVASVSRGARSIEDERAPVTLDTLFRLHSLTKMITALTLLRLCEQGVLDLRARLADIAPRLSAAAPGLLADLTVRQLLSHTSGLPDGPTEIAGDGRDPGALAEQTRRIATGLTAMAHPGDVYSYSNYAYCVLGAAVEEATGHPYADVVAEQVARPLGLASLCFDPVVAMTRPLSQQHPRVRGRLTVDHWYGESVRMYPAAMAFLSPADLARLGRMYLLDGLVPDAGRRFLAPAAIAEQRRRQVDIGLVDDRHYGLGAYVGPPAGGTDCFGHEGYFTGMWCNLQLFPGQDAGIAWCDNRGHEPELSDARREVIDEICRELGVPARSPQRPPGTDVPDEARLAGTYSRRAARPVHVEGEPGALRLRLGADSFALVHHGASVYRMDVPPHLMKKPPLTPHSGSSIPSVAFHRATNGSGSYMSVNGIVYGRAL